MQSWGYRDPTGFARLIEVLVDCSSGCFGRGSQVAETALACLAGGRPDPRFNLSDETAGQPSPGERRSQRQLIQSGERDHNRSAKSAQLGWRLIADGMHRASPCISRLPATECGGYWLLSIGGSAFSLATAAASSPPSRFVASRPPPTPAQCRAWPMINALRDRCRAPAAGQNPHQGR